MTKLITVTGRSGAGKTTVAAILAEKLSEKYIVCLVDNNRDNINIYSSLSTIENIKLYFCLNDKASCCRAIKESAAKLNKNLYFFSGSNELLTKDEIQIFKEQEIFEYIILDSGINVEQSDFEITVINPNRREYEMTESSDKNIIVINRYAENTEFKVDAKDFKLYFCPEIINFPNGFFLTLPEENEKEIKKLIEKITGERLKNSKTRPKFRLFGGI